MLDTPHPYLSAIVVELPVSTIIFDDSHMPLVDQSGEIATVTVNLVNHWAYVTVLCEFTTLLARPGTGFTMSEVQYVDVVLESQYCSVPGAGLLVPSFSA